VKEQNAFIKIYYILLVSHMQIILPLKWDKITLVENSIYDYN